MRGPVWALDIDESMYAVPEAYLHMYSQSARKGDNKLMRMQSQWKHT